MTLFVAYAKIAMNMIHLISFTKAGFSLSQRIQKLLFQSGVPECEITVSYGGKILKNDFSLGDEVSSINMSNIPISVWVEKNFKQGNALVFVSAAGIAVRSISPFVKSKETDPAVLVIDEKGRFVIPILSGHIGGANALARRLASFLDTQAVITTASDINNLPAIDEFAKKNNLSINDMNFAKNFTANLLKSSGVNSEANFQNIGFSISIYEKKDILNLIPKSLIMGIGLKKGKSSEELEKFILGTLKNYKIDYRSLGKITSINLKRDEKAILDFSEKHKLPFVCYTVEELNAIHQKVEGSEFVKKITGTDNICERSVFAAGAEKLLIPKTARNGMTLAVGIKNIEFRIPDELKSFLIP